MKWQRERKESEFCNLHFSKQNSKLKKAQLSIALGKVDSGGGCGVWVPFITPPLGFLAVSGGMNAEGF